MVNDQPGTTLRFEHWQLKIGIKIKEPPRACLSRDGNCMRNLHPTIVTNTNGCNKEWGKNCCKNGQGILSPRYNSITILLPI